ncbi:MAG: hypothetical protein WCS20_10335 [Alphaproteobacteria bacterium]
MAPILHLFGEWRAGANGLERVAKSGTARIGHCAARAGATMRGRGLGGLGL